MDIPTDAVYTAMQHVRVVSYVNTASLALLVYDYLLNLHLEISLLWPSRWTTTKVFYFIIRYIPFISCSLIFYHQILPNATQRRCELTYLTSGWGFTAGMALAEIILTLRVWAVWGKDRRLTIALPIFYLACWIPIIVILANFFKTIRFGPAPLPQFPGCFVTAGSPLLYLDWVFLMIYDAGNCSLMIYKASRTYSSDGNNGLHRVVYRDGVLYYVYLFVLSALNVILTLVEPPDYVALIAALEQAVHSLLTCRVILNIREQVADCSVDGSLLWSTGDTELPFRPASITSSPP